MSFGAKTNERPGTRAVVRYARISAYKSREVLDLIRGKEVGEADDLLRFSERDAAIVIRKAVASAVANAQKNDNLDPDELYVSACFADEGPTLKRWRPRARGRATRIRKRTCHITVIVSRLSEAELDRRREREAASPTVRATRRAGRAAAEARRERVAKSRAAQEEHDHEHDEEAAPVADAEPEAADAIAEGEAAQSSIDIAEEDAPETAIRAEGLATVEPDTAPEPPAAGATDTEEEK